MTSRTVLKSCWAKEDAQHLQFKPKDSVIRFHSSFQAWRLSWLRAHCFEQKGSQIDCQVINLQNCQENQPEFSSAVFLWRSERKPPETPKPPGAFSSLREVFEAPGPSGPQGVAVSAAPREKRWPPLVVSVKKCSFLRLFLLIYEVY